MENDWQICELEDNKKSFVEFTVSAVPEIWIFEREDGTMWCYWPKTNAVNKIKSKEQPKPNWMTYKCRILMNAETFSNYEKAIEAEIYCQNHSTLMDCTETENGSTQQENVCDSTMDFDVTWYMDDDDENDEKAVVGHDSFEFNKEIAKARRLHSKTETLKLPGDLPKIYNSDETSEESDEGGHSENEDASSEKHVSVDADFAAKFDYSQFKNVASISTSTVLEVADAIRKGNDLPNDDIETFLSKISKIEMSVVNDVQKHFHELKEVAKSILMKPGLSFEVARLESVNGNGNSPHNNELSKHDEAPNGSENVSNMAEIVKDTLTRDIQGGKPGAVVTSSSPVYIAQNLNRTVVVNDLIPREPTVICDCPNASDQVQIEVPKSVEIMEVSHGIPNKENATGDANCEERVMHFPVGKIEHYRMNEGLLDEEEGSELATALVENLAPFNDEDETAYVNRTVGLIFDDDFFINNVKWRPQEGCAFMKSSSIMVCWKESHGKKFPPDISNQRFIAHFRRIKSAKRAAIKAKAKQKLKSNSKKFII